MHGTTHIKFVTVTSRAVFYKQRNVLATLMNSSIFKVHFAVLIPTNHTSLLRILIRNGPTIRRRFTVAGIRKNHSLCNDSEDRIFFFMF